MKSIRPILRDSALLLVPMAALGAWTGGLWSAVGVVVSGLVALVNLAALAWLVGRFAHAVETDEPQPAALLGLALKPLVALVAFGGLMAAFDPVSVAFGLGAIVLGVCIRGLLPSADRDATGYECGPSDPAERGSVES